MCPHRGSDQHRLGNLEVDSAAGCASRCPSLRVRTVTAGVGEVSALTTAQARMPESGASSVTALQQRIARLTILGVCLVVPLVFAPWRGEVFAPLKIQVLQGILGVGLLATGAVALRQRRLETASVSRVDLAVLAFAALNLVSYLHSRDRRLSLHGVFPEYQGAATVLTYLGAYYLARLAFAPGPKATGPQVLVALFRALTVTTGIIGGYALAQRAGYDPLWGFAGRPFSTIGQPNSMAAMLVVGLPATAATFSLARPTAPGPSASRSAWVRGWCMTAALAGVLGLGGLLASLSRGGWLAALVAGGVGLAVHRPSVGRGTVFATGGVLGFVVIAVLCVPAGQAWLSHAGARVAAMHDVQTGSTAKHVALARIGLGLSLEHPWLGAGHDVFPELAQPYADRHLPSALAAQLRPRMSESPHNALLTISAGCGIPALLIYLTILGVAVRGLLGTRRNTRLYAATALMMLTGYFVASLFITPEVSSTVTFWIALGAACSALPTEGRRPRSTCSKLT